MLGAPDSGEIAASQREALARIESEVPFDVVLAYVSRVDADHSEVGRSLKANFRTRQTPPFLHWSDLSCAQ